MYTLLMMSALAGGPDAPAFGERFFGPTYGACNGVSYVPSYYSSCSGSSCYGGACSGYASCCGYGSCCGYSSYASACCGYTACSGGGLFSGGGFLSKFHSSCHGCCGYSSTSSCCGYGSCCGTSSSYYYGSCCGYSSCCGGCYGSPYYSAYGGCYGSSCVGGYPTYSPMFAPAPVMGVPVMGVPVEGVVVGSAARPVGPVMTASRVEEGTNGLLAAVSSSASAPARMVIELPAKAKLFVDGNVIPGGGTSRQFHTPDLARGKAFYYELKAEVLIDGKVEVEEKKIVVRAGDSAMESFPKLIALAKPSKPAVLAAK